MILYVETSYHKLYENQRTLSQHVVVQRRHFRLHSIHTRLIPNKKLHTLFGPKRDAGMIN
jgi:hypothetical protein